jgi:hypothetical protein
MVEAAKAQLACGLGGAQSASNSGGSAFYGDGGGGPGSGSGNSGRGSRRRGAHAGARSGRSPMEGCEPPASEGVGGGPGSGPGSAALGGSSGGGSDAAAFAHGCDSDAPSGPPGSTDPATTGAAGAPGSQAWGQTPGAAELDAVGLEMGRTLTLLVSRLDSSASQGTALAGPSRACCRACWGPRLGAAAAAAAGWRETRLGAPAACDTMSQQPCRPPPCLLISRQSTTSPR